MKMPVHAVDGGDRLDVSIACRVSTCTSTQISSSARLA